MSDLGELLGVSVMAAMGGRHATYVSRCESRIWQDDKNGPHSREDEKGERGRTVDKELGGIVP